MGGAAPGEGADQLLSGCGIVAHIFVRIEEHAQLCVQGVGGEEQPFEEVTARGRLRGGGHCAVPVGQPQQDRCGLEERALGCLQHGDQSGGVECAVGRAVLTRTAAVHQNGAVGQAHLLQRKADDQRGIVWGIVKHIGHGR